MGFTSYRCPFPRVWTSKENKVLGNAKFAHLRLRQNDLSLCCNTSLNIAKDSLVLVSPRQRRRVWLTWGCPLASLSLSCPTAWLWYRPWCLRQCRMLLPRFACWIAWAFSPRLLVFYLVPLPLSRPGCCDSSGSRRGWGSSSDSLVITWDHFPSLTSLHGSLTIISARCGQVRGFMVHVRVRSGAQQHLRCKAVSLGCTAPPGHYQSLWLCDKGFISSLSGSLQCCLSPCKDQKGWTWQLTDRICSSGLNHPWKCCVVGERSLCSDNSSAKFGYTLLLLFLWNLFLAIKGL